MIWAEQVSYLILQIKLSYLRMSGVTRDFLSAVAKTVWEITEIWSFPCFYSFSTPILWAGLSPGPFTFPCPGSSLKLRSLVPGRWCGVEILGDSGTDGCGLRRQRERENPVFYTCGLLKLLNLSVLPDVSCDYNKI